ncbi:MAG: FKBP-type peptidyl-prolyl cis-trans isomerase [bacterium]|jgi:FKBP-type peptidyl-prolyl cis-trans isomerase SlyD
MKVGKDKVVTLTYELRQQDESGELIQKVEKKRPFVHLFGAGTLLPAFEDNLKGLVPGDEFGFHLTSDEAYGQSSGEAIIEVDKSIFEIDGKIDEDILSLGNTVAMQDGDGNPINGIVMDIREKTVLMDFNHPLAGQDLYFSGTILEVRDATEEEVSHGHVHGDGGHHH